MTLKKLDLDLAVCRLDSAEGVDFAGKFVSLTRTAGEISLVCEQAYTPPGANAVEPGWCAFEIQGELDFALVGVVADITKWLAEQGISVFVLSTYNTDYILVKAVRAKEAARALRHGGYEVT